MYETASQKSASRLFNDPDYRSYSMTQTSYSAYTLSNHRSYASLRSQQDGSGHLQRPRSPFAYPARLRRPGFRPSSPALTDGGIVDYSRRAEIDRKAYGGHSTSSPSSLYAQKRKPPLSLRQDANRSTHSLLSQPSPPRRSPSPGLRQSSGNIAQDWSRRNGSSGNTSPARSTFSLASTVNLYATVSGTSNATTPGKLAPPSPLYYDYTEDFEVDGYNRAEESLGSPPHFSIDKTIPEERRASAERPPSMESRVHRLSSSPRPPSSPTPTPANPKPLEGTQNRMVALLSGEQFESVQPSHNKRHTSIRETNNSIDKKIVRLSGLGFGAQELSTHVEEAFGLLPTNSFEVSVSQNESEEVTSGNLNGEVLGGKRGKIAETQFMSSFSNRCDAYPPRLSSLPSTRSGSRTDAITTHEGERSIDTTTHARASPDPVQLPRASTSLPDSSRSRDMETAAQGSNFASASTSSQSRLRSSSGFKPMDPGFAELTDLLKTLEQSNRGRHPAKAQPVFTAPIETPILTPPYPNGSVLCSTNINHAQSPIITSSNRPSTKELHASTQIQPTKRNQLYNGGRKAVAPTLATYEGFDAPIFNNQTAIRAIPRSSSPMLAPKPISPARQLKLKNSVPQLMKALPTLPAEPLVRATSPINALKSTAHEMPYHFSPLIPELSPPPVQESRHESHKVVSAQGPPVPPKEEVLKARAAFGSRSSEAISEQPPSSGSPTISQPLPRLKLKMKSFTNLRPRSPPSPRPWEREEIQTCSIPDPDAPVQEPAQSEKPANPKPPKFRLKITRASTSTFGTVRVNRESGESGVAAGFHLPSHKDLFTSTSGIDNIFRQVSQHLHSRKTSVASNTGSESFRPSTSLLSPKSHLAPKTTSPTMDFDISKPQSTKPLLAHEARNVLSDNTSHMQGHGGMRGRLSNLTARVAPPYANRIGSQSYDDLTWRDRNLPEATAPIAQRSACNLHSRSKSTESKPLRRFAERMHHHRLREKVQGWVKEARTVIKSRMKSRSTTGSGQDEVGP